MTRTLRLLSRKSLRLDSQFLNSYQRLGLQHPHSAAPTSAAGQTERAFASLHKKIGRLTSRQSSRRLCRSSNLFKKNSTLLQLAERKFRLPTSSFSAAMRPSKNPQKQLDKTLKSRSLRAAWTRRKSRPTLRRSNLSNRRPTASATISTAQ